jgi:mannose-6-phosphate isomerase-like protein (cupin superfamily)
MIVNQDTAYHYKWGKACEGWVYLARDDMLVIEELMPPGTSEHRHKHLHARQFFQAIEGSLTIEVEGEEFALAPGDALEVPPGQRHQVRNDSEANVRFLNLSSPSAHGDRVNDTDEP